MEWSIALIKESAVGCRFAISTWLEVWERHKLSAGFGAEPRPKTIIVLSRPDRTPLIVMSVMLFDKPENVQ